MNSSLIMFILEVNTKKRLKVWLAILQMEQVAIKDVTALFRKFQAGLRSKSSTGRSELRYSCISWYH
jgi:hypothetical protein